MLADRIEGGLPNQAPESTALGNIATVNFID